MRLLSMTEYSIVGVSCLPRGVLNNTKTHTFGLFYFCGLITALNKIVKYALFG